MLCSRYDWMLIGDEFYCFLFYLFFYENDSFPRQWVTIKLTAMGCAAGKQKKKKKSLGVMVCIWITIFFEQLKIVQQG